MQTSRAGVPIKRHQRTIRRGNKFRLISYLLLAELLLWSLQNLYYFVLTFTGQFNQDALIIVETLSTLLFLMDPIIYVSCLDGLAKAMKRLITRGTCSVRFPRELSIHKRKHPAGQESFDI